MKTTTSGNTANPRRTTLAHLKDAAHLIPTERPEHPLTLPTRTANPRRTILMVAPAASAASTAQDLSPAPETAAPDAATAQDASTGQ